MTYSWRRRLRTYGGGYFAVAIAAATAGTEGALRKVALLFMSKASDAFTWTVRHLRIAVLDNEATLSTFSRPVCHNDVAHRGVSIGRRLKLTN